jgi:hypothetical protein
MFCVLLLKGEVCQANVLFASDLSMGCFCGSLSNYNSVGTRTGKGNHSLAYFCASAKTTRFQALAVGLHGRKTPSTLRVFWSGSWY